MVETVARVSRYAAVDVARGVAIVGVVLFHIVWNLDFLGFIPSGIATHPLWIAFGRSLAATFMALVGVSLVLAARRGIDWRSVTARLFRLVLAALAVSIATVVVFPQAWIYFGILHAIVAATLVGLAFLRVAPVVAILVGGAMIVAGLSFESPAFDARWAAWIGFSASPYPSNDFAPVFPWAGFTLIGLAAARLALERGWMESLPRFEGRLGHLLAVAGRWSLVIYLVHQPVLLAILVPLASFVQP